MSNDLSRSVAVRTGAGSGIGRATAHALGRRGAHVVVTDLDEDRAKTVVDGVAANRFLIVTTDEVHDELRALGNDLDAYLARVAADA